MLRIETMSWFEGALRTDWLIWLWFLSAVGLSALFYFWTRGTTSSRKMVEPWKPKRFFHFRHPRDPRPSI